MFKFGLQKSQKRPIFSTWNPFNANKLYFPVLIHPLTENEGLQKFQHYISAPQFQMSASQTQGFIFCTHMGNDTCAARLTKPIYTPTHPQHHKHLFICSDHITQNLQFFLLSCTGAFFCLIYLKDQLLYFYPLLGVCSRKVSSYCQRQKLLIHYLLSINNF